VGDHGCEYMTGGRVVVLGPTGYNFAAGMSGGIAYVLDPEDDFDRRCNQELVNLGKIEDPDEADEVRALVAEHLERTGSPVAAELLADWGTALPQLVRVMPSDYEKVLQQRVESEQQSGEAEDVDDDYPSSNGVAERAPREQVGA